METPPVTVKKTLANSLTKKSLTPCRRIGLGRPSSGSLKKLVQVRTVNTPSSDSCQVENQNSLSVILQNKTNETSACSLALPISSNSLQNRDTTRVRRCLTQDLKTNELQNVKRSLIENQVEKSITSNEVKSVYSSVIEEPNHNNQFKKFKSCLALPTTIINNEVVEGCENKNQFTCKNYTTTNQADISKFKNSEEITEEDIAQLMLSLLEKRKRLEQLKVQKAYAKKHNLEDLRAQTVRWREAGQEALQHCVRLARQAGFPVTINQLMVQHGFPQDLMGYNPDEDEFE